MLRSGGCSEPIEMWFTARQRRVPEASLVWTSNQDGLIGRGNRVNLKKLSSGTHTLTLTVTDSQGQKTTA